MNLPVGARGRVLAVGLLLIALLLVFQIAVLPAWHSYAQLQEDIDAGTSELHSLQRIADQLPALRRQQQQLDAEQPLAPYLLPGKSRAIAGARLQQHLQELVRKNNGRIISLRTLAPETVGALERIALEVRLQVPMDGLLQILLDLENSRPSTRLTQFSVTVRRGRVKNAAANELDVRLTLYALRAADPAEDGKRG